MKRSNWVRLIAVILIISMLAAPVSAATNRGSDGVRANGLIGTIVEIIRDIIRDIFDDWFDKPGDGEPVPTEPIETTAPTAPGETEPTEPGETEPGETKPTEPGETKPGETKPTEPGETEPDEPELNEPPQSPDNDLELIEGHANTANGHLLRGVTYSLANIIAQQGEPLTTATANRFGTKLGNSLGGNAVSTGLKTMASKGGIQTMASNGGIQTMAEVDITDGLVAHYDFETVNGTTVTNNVTNNTTAELKNGAIVTDSDHMGKAMQLTSAQDGMQLKNTVNAAETSFSISMWYKLNGTSTVNVNLAQAGTISGSSGRTILILQPNSTYKSYLTGNDAVVTTNSVERTEWQHITFVYDKDNSKGYFYINGKADNAAGVDMGSTAPVSTSDMIIGRHRSVEGACDGLIDEVRIYNKVLSAEEAAAIYKYGSTDSEEPSEPEQPVVDPTDDSRDIPTSVLTATAGDYETDGGDNEGPPSLALDGNQDTMWHTDWYGTSRANHWIQFQLSADYKVDGLRYLPRRGDSTNGTITEYKIQVSDDGVNFRDVASGNWEADRNWKIAQFEGENVKYVRLVAVNATTDNSYVFASAAEIRLTGEVYEAPTPDPDPEQPETGYEVVRFPVTMFNYNNGTTWLNDDSILRNLTHKAEIEAALEAGLDPAEKTLWEGLYFSGGTPENASSYTYSTAAATHTDLTWQQVKDGTYYADEACTNKVAVNEVVEGSGEYQQVEVSIGDLWNSFGGNEVDVKYATNYFYYNTNAYLGSTGYYLVYVSKDSSGWIYLYWPRENGNYNQFGVYLLTHTVSLYEQTGTITDYTLTAGGQTLATLNGTDLSAKVNVPLYTPAGTKEITKHFARWNFWAYRTAQSESSENQNKFYAGLVQDELVNGEIKFNVVEPGIFTFDPDHPEITKDEVKDIYQNVGLPFVKNEKGYYTFDSDAHGTYFSDTTGDGKSDPGYGASDNYFDMYFDYQNTQGWADKSDPDSHLGYGDKSKNLWAPYNTNANDTGEGAIDYHFGMRADIPFSMTSNGCIKSTDDNSEHITFTFQGDDDVWIFIDGHLVIDLGGIHNRLGATIDFANNTIEYFLPESNRNDNPFGAFGVENFEMIQKLYNDAAGEGALGQTRFDFSSEEEHEMSIFYLERGMGTSNCKIEFNLPMRDTLLITKDATKSWSAEQDAVDGDKDGTVELTPREQAAVDNILFGFTLYKKEGSCFDENGNLIEDAEFAPVVNTNFFIQDKEGNIVGHGSTDGNGHFNLKNGQTAKFMTDFPKEGVSYYVVEDAVPQGFLTPDYNYAGVATQGFRYAGQALDVDSEIEDATKFMQGYVADASLIEEHELPMNAAENKSYVITAYGSVESIDSLEFIAVNYLDQRLPNPSAIANEDIIVIDYGLPVEIDPLANDVFRGKDVEIVAWGDETLELNEVMLQGTNSAVDHESGAENKTSWTGTQNFHSGEVTFNDVTYAEHEHKTENEDGTTTTTYTYTRDSFEYKLTKQLTEVEVISYIIKVTSDLTNDVTGLETTACRYSLAKVYIVPATIMYYEENFSDMIHFEGSGWDKDYTTANQGNVSPHQEPGVVGTIGDSTYGSDLAYLSDDGDSNGTYRFGDTTQTVDEAGNKTGGAIRFTYTFTGTGTSIFARTSAKTGYMQVKLYPLDENGNVLLDEDGNKILEEMVYRDTYWKYLNENNLAEGDCLYNIPVYTSNENLAYGTYMVVCTVAKAGTLTEGNPNGAGNEFYLDGIRVMQPLDDVFATDPDSGECYKKPIGEVEPITAKALEAYATDGEANLDVVTLRQKLITDHYYEPEEGEENTEKWPFAVLTDIDGNIVMASDYVSIGPKEEVYLSAATGATNAQSVSFSLKYWETEGLKLYMGMKAPFGQAKVHVGAETIELFNAPDCYYDVTKSASVVEETDEDGNTYFVATFTFTAAESIVSLTNIKVVGTHEFVIIENTDQEIDGNEGGNA